MFVKQISVHDHRFRVGFVNLEEISGDGGCLLSVTYSTCGGKTRLGGVYTPGLRSYFATEDARSFKRLDEQFLLVRSSRT